jgi:acyl-CoA thioesterase YciA
MNQTSADIQGNPMEANGTDKEPVIRTIAMSSDINPAGDIFGGWLMSQMDLAAGNAAARRARGRCVTEAVDGMVTNRSR